MGRTENIYVVDLECLFLTRRCLAPGTEAMFADLGHFSFRSIQVNTPVCDMDSCTIDDHTALSIHAVLQFVFEIPDRASGGFCADCVHFPGISLLDGNLSWAGCIPCETYGRRERPFLFLSSRYVASASNTNNHICLHIYLFLTQMKEISLSERICLLIFYYFNTSGEK